MSVSPPAAADPREPAPLPERWLGLIGLCLGVFMFTLDASIVNVALPTLVGVFRTTFSTVQWIAKELQTSNSEAVRTAIRTYAMQLADLARRKT